MNYVKKGKTMRLKLIGFPSATIKTELKYKKNNELFYFYKLSFCNTTINIM